MADPVTGSRDVTTSEARVSLKHFISDRVWTDGILARIVRSVSVGVKMIARAARRGTLGAVFRQSGDSVRVGSPRTFKRAAHRVLAGVLKRANACPVLASTEAGVVDRGTTRHEESTYAVRFDPIDDPSTVRDGRTAGTTFSVHRLPDSAPTDDGALESIGAASEPLVSGYGRYGPSTQFVVADQRRVDGFVLDPEIGTFFLVHEDLRIPDDGEYVAMTGPARVTDIPRGQPREERSGSADRGGRGSVRAGGSLVAHVHAILLRGGVVRHVTGACGAGDPPHRSPRIEALTFLVEAAGGRVVADDSSQSDPFGTAEARSSVRIGSPVAVRSAGGEGLNDAARDSPS